MWTWGGARSLGGRALAATLVGALVVGTVTAVIVAPGAVGRPAPSSTHVLSHFALRLDGGRVTVEGRVHGSPAPPGAPVAVPVALVRPGTAGPGSVADPTTEAGVAAHLITAIDARSGGRYRIGTTPDNVSLLETWMDNEGGLWADNPLNTSLDAARYPHQFTTAGDDTSIPIFPDIQIGIDATAATLLSSRAYSAILWTLSEGTATCDAFALVVMASPWAASHYGGDPSHFCGNSGDGGTPGVGVTACLRLRDRAAGAVRRAQRMPGACDGHVTGAAGHGRRGSGRHQRAGAIPARGHHHVTRLPAAPPRQRPVGHRAPLRAAGTVRHRR